MYTLTRAPTKNIKTSAYTARHPIHPLTTLTIPPKNKRGAFTKTNILLKLQSEHDELSQISVFADKDERNPTARAYQMFVLATSPPDGFGTVRDKLLIRDAPASPRRGSVHPASVVSVGSKLPRPMCTDSCAQYWTPRHFPKGTKYLQA